MDYKKIGLGLGVFSIGLGLLEVAAPARARLPVRWRSSAAQLLPIS